MGGMVRRWAMLIVCVFVVSACASTRFQQVIDVPEDSPFFQAVALGEITGIPTAAEIAPAGRPAEVFGRGWRPDTSLEQVTKNLSQFLEANNLAAPDPMTAAYQLDVMIEAFPITPNGQNLSSASQLTYRLLDRQKGTTVIDQSISTTIFSRGPQSYADGTATGVGTALGAIAAGASNSEAQALGAAAAARKTGKSVSDRDILLAYLDAFIDGMAANTAAFASALSPKIEETQSND
ncbi:MAG: hypothetical protein AAGL49_03690 [Pseudomonadota bacterium]